MSLVCVEWQGSQVFGSDNGLVEQMYIGPG